MSLEFGRYGYHDNTAAPPLSECRSCGGLYVHGWFFDVCPTCVTASQGKPTAISPPPVINVGWPTIPVPSHQTITSATSGVTHVVGWRNRHGVHITGCGNAVYSGKPESERVMPITCKTCAGLIRAGCGDGDDKS